MRRDYERGTLDEASLNEDPIAELREWLSAAVAAKVVEPNAMALGTASADGTPNVRIVLCKGVDARGIVFYTNYRSTKARELDENPRAALDFLWRELTRQVRVQGQVEKIGPTESDAYFRSRPRGSQLGAWASENQSAEITRAELDRRLADLEKKYAGTEIPRPPFWGGYRVIPDRFEFWLGGPDRLHDCIAYVRENDGWRKMRVSP
ncbi:MAG: pyridoxamine 5'-phosphate oxidase [Polyangiaceae bacterium]